MAVDADYMEIKCLKFLVNRIGGANLAPGAVDLKSVIIHNHDQIIQLSAMGIKEIRLLLKERLKSPKHCILVSSHNLTEIAAITDVLIFIQGGKIIKIIENNFNEKELEALYEDIMTSGQKEEA